MREIRYKNVSHLEVLILDTAFGTTTTTDAAMLSPALGTLCAQTFLEIETDGIVASTVKHVFDFSWAVEKISELPRLGCVNFLSFSLSTSFAFASVAPGPFSVALEPPRMKLGPARPTAPEDHFHDRVQRVWVSDTDPS